MIAPFKRIAEAVVYRINPVLPQAYDDSLSYFEVLAKLQKKVNELITAVNQLMDAVEELDSRVGVLEKWRTDVVDPFIERITNWKDTVVDPFISDITNWKDNVVDPFIETMTTKIERIEGDITDLYNTKQDKLTAGDGITIINNVISSLAATIATTSQVGVVKPDGSTITIDQDGTIHSVGGGGGGGSVEWSSVLNKPFNTVGANLAVQNSALTVKNASSTDAGVIKTYWDSSSSTLYITDNGNSPVPN